MSVCVGVRTVYVVGCARVPMRSFVAPPRPSPSPSTHEGEEGEGVRKGGERESLGVERCSCGPLFVVGGRGDGEIATGEGEGAEGEMTAEGDGDRTAFVEIGWLVDCGTAEDEGEGVTG